MTKNDGYKLANLSIQERQAPTPTEDHSNKNEPHLRISAHKYIL
jgi:hypothetical protein